jgi:hypothetical protein
MVRYDVSSKSYTNNLARLNKVSWNFGWEFHFDGVFCMMGLCYFQESWMKTMVKVHGMVLCVLVLVGLSMIVGCEAGDLVDALGAFPTAVNSQITDSVTKAIQ